MVIASAIVPDELELLNTNSAPSPELALLNATSALGVPVDVEPLITASALKLPDELLM